MKTHIGRFSWKAVAKISHAEKSGLGFQAAENTVFLFSPLPLTSRDLEVVASRAVSETA
jgi:hypothetical protein